MKDKQCSVNLIMGDGTIKMLTGTPEEVAKLIRQSVDAGEKGADIIQFPLRGIHAHPSNMKGN